MRWLVLLVVVVIGLLFWYDDGFSIQGVPLPWVKTPPAPAPTQLIGIGGTPRPWSGFATLAPTPTLPPEERIKGTWVRLGENEYLDFKGDGVVSGVIEEFGIGFSEHYTYSFSEDQKTLHINWNATYTNNYLFARKWYFYEFQDDMLILTESDNLSNRYIFLHFSRDRQNAERVGPKPARIIGRLVGPSGVLDNQQISLKAMCFPTAHFCPPEMTTITDSTGKYIFPHIKRWQMGYVLNFIFTTTEPDEIPEDAEVGAFILKKLDSEITASTSTFFVNGFERDSEIIIDFVYPSSPPPTITPSPVPATPVLTPTVQPTSTSSQGMQVPAAPTLSPTSVAATGTFTVSVPANVVWFDTGRVVQPGQRLTLSASGSINLQGGDPADEHIPDGSKSLIPCRDVANCLMNEVPYGKLIAKIGEGQPFEVGANLETSAAAGGKLYLAVNDHYYPDNTGEYKVTVTVNSPN